MTADKAILGPGENLTLTVYYQNISKKEIWVPDPGDWLLHGYADIESGAASLHKASFDHHSSPKKLKAGERSSFNIELESPIDEVGFLQINLRWGSLEEIVPNPITVECRKPKRLQPSNQPATAPKSTSESNEKPKPASEPRPQ